MSSYQVVEELPPLPDDSSRLPERPMPWTE